MKNHSLADYQFDVFEIQFQYPVKQWFFVVFLGNKSIID